ncbi:Disks large-associated protein 2 [Plecturocebus cupreus]
MTCRTFLSHCVTLILLRAPLTRCQNVHQSLRIASAPVFRITPVKVWLLASALALWPAKGSRVFSCRFFRAAHGFMVRDPGKSSAAASNQLGAPEQVPPPLTPNSLLGLETSAGLLCGLHVVETATDSDTESRGLREYHSVGVQVEDEKR